MISLNCIIVMCSDTCQPFPHWRIPGGSSCEQKDHIRLFPVEHEWSWQRRGLRGLSLTLKTMRCILLEHATFRNDYLSEDVCDVYPESESACCCSPFSAKLRQKRQCILSTTEANKGQQHEDIFPSYFLTNGTLEDKFSDTFLSIVWRDSFLETGTQMLVMNLLIRWCEGLIGSAAVRRKKGGKCHPQNSFIHIIVFVADSSWSICDVQRHESCLFCEVWKVETLRVHVFVRAFVLKNIWV